MNPVAEIAVAITFHYRDVRLKYLELTCSSLAGMQQNFRVHVMTNAGERQTDRVSELLDRIGITYEIHHPTLLGHSYLLSCSHLAIFRELLKKHSGDLDQARNRLTISAQLKNDTRKYQAAMRYTRSLCR